MSSTVHTLVLDALNALVIIGWVLLIVIGLEPDKPLSGGIPGHVDPQNRDVAAREGLLGRLGEIGAWVLFGLISLSLPIILIWILRVHA